MDGTRSWARTYRVEGDAVVDVDELARLFVDEDVGAVAVAEADGVANHRRCGRAPGVLEPHREPCERRLVLLGEEVAHDRVDAARRLGKLAADLLGRVRVLPLGNLLPEVAQRWVVRIVPAQSDAIGTLSSQRWPKERL
jgi:hypothetical protein